MPRTFSREDFYELVWSRPLTHLARELGVSDVALHKHCRVRGIPKPPQGYWLKKEYGKPAARSPLGADPSPHPGLPITIYPGAGADENGVSAAARARVHEALAAAGEHTPLDCPVLARTLAALNQLKTGKAKAGRAKAGKIEAGQDGAADIAGPGLVTVRVRGAVMPRAATLLEALVRTAARAGIALEASDSGALWRAEGETVSFELVEVADRIAHVATDQELRELAKWEAECAAYVKRTGYTRDWGRPYIPKWEERLQGRLAVVFEAVRDRSTSEYGGTPLRSKFADAKNRDLAQGLAHVVAAIAVIGATKRANAAADAQRRRAREEAERRRAEAERRAALERARSEALEGLLARHEAEVRLAGWLAALERTCAAGEAPLRIGRLRGWAAARLARLRARSAPGALEAWLAEQALFEEAGEEEARGEGEGAG